MALYDLVNPSDAACFETDDEAALRVGVMLLGSGRYGLTREDGSEALPLMFVGEPAVAGAREAADFLSVGGNPSRVAKALRTILYSRLADAKALRAAFAELPEEIREKAIRKFNDEKRSSLNNIGERCFLLADELDHGRVRLGA